MFSGCPLTVDGIAPLLRVISAETVFPDRTWYVRIEVNASLFASNDSTVPAGNFAKAASVGAKTVNGPAPCSVSARPAALTAATRVLKLPFSEATCTMFFGVVATGVDAHAESV